MKPDSSKAFWIDKKLHEMSPDEWESLCDGCGRCCLHKIREDSGELFFTNVACRLLDTAGCQCKDYDNRIIKVSTCFVITADNVNSLDWLPTSCAYRLLASGSQLKWWHPLVSKDPNTVIEAGISVTGRCISEEQVHADSLEDFVVSWLD